MEPLYSSLVNALDGIVWEADPETFQFVFVSRQAETILGYPVERWLSEPGFWRSHIHPDDVAWAVDLCSRATAEGRSHQFEYRMMAADGRVVWLRDVVTVTAEDGRPVRLRGVMVDVTDRRRSDESRARQARYTALRADVGAALARTDVTAREALQACSDAVALHIETTFTCIWTVETAGGQLALRAASCSVTPDDPLSGLPDLSVEARRIAEGRRPVLEAGIYGEIEMEDLEWARREGIVSFVGVPLLIGDRLVGVVMAYSRRLLPDDTLDQLAPIADIVAHGIERRRLEEAQLESERRLSTLLGNLPGMVYRCHNDRDWPMEFVSEGCHSLTGYGAEALLAGDGTLYGSLIAPEYRESIVSEVQVALDERRLFQLVYRFRTASGVERWAWERGRGVYDADGAVVAIEGFVTDVTERRRAEEALRQSEIYFRSLIENSTDVVLVLSEAGTIVYASPAAERVVGIEAEELVGRNMVTLMHPDDLPRAVEIFQSSLARDEASPRVEYRMQRDDGALSIVEASGKRFVDTAGRVKVIVNLRDIGERRKAEEALALSEQKYRRIVDTALEGIWTIDAESKITYANRRLAEMLGHEVEEMLGRSILDFTDAAARRQAEREIALVEAGESRRVELRLRRKDGSEAWTIVSANPIFDELGGYVGALGMVADISEHRQLEEQLRHAQKMEAIGRFAGGVAHDFNNLLTTIIGYSDLSLREPEVGETLRFNLEEIKRSGERATSLTRQLLAFSRKQILQPRVLDLNTLVSDMQKMLERLIGEDIALTTELDAELGRVKADPGQIEQVLMNLVVNARDAMPRGGTLRIRTAGVTLEGAEARRLTGGSEGRYVELEVDDTGCGMSPEVQARVFEPFFTTKDVGQGTGLGLATVYGIVQQSGGHVHVESEVGAGTTLRVYLPEVEEEESVETTRASGSYAPLAGHETILLVEDEHVLRRMAREILEMNGYVVIEAPDGAAAIEQVGRYDGALDLLLTDVVMPNMSGGELATQLKSLRPSTRVLYMSGYSDDDVIRYGVAHDEAAFLQKPFTPRQLAKAVRAAIDRTE